MCQGKKAEGDRGGPLRSSSGFSRSCAYSHIHVPHPHSHNNSKTGFIILLLLPCDKTLYTTGFSIHKSLLVSKYYRACIVKDSIFIQNIVNMISLDTGGGQGVDIVLIS